MSESALPPEERARVKQFNPVDLDRTIIAVPLLQEMKKDFERIELLKVRGPQRPRRVQRGHRISSRLS